MKTTETTTQAQSVRWGKAMIVAFALTAAFFMTSAHLSASDKPLDKKDDATITRQIKESLLFHLQLDTMTETKEGVVTLSGRARTAAEKELNTKLASKIPGVKIVNNRMTIPVALAGNN